LLVEQHSLLATACILKKIISKLETGGHASASVAHEQNELQKLYKLLQTKQVVPNLLMPLDCSSIKHKKHNVHSKQSHPQKQDVQFTHSRQLLLLVSMVALQKLEECQPWCKSFCERNSSFLQASPLIFSERIVGRAALTFSDAVHSKENHFKT
jgi:hypothetical protein